MINVFNAINGSNSFSKNAVYQKASGVEKKHFFIEMTNINACKQKQKHLQERASLISLYSELVAVGGEDMVVACWKGDDSESLLDFEFHELSLVLRGTGRDGVVVLVVVDGMSERRVVVGWNSKLLFLLFLTPELCLLE